MGGEKLSPAVACCGGADSVLSISFIQCSCFIHGNPGGTVVVARSASTMNKAMPVAGSVGRGRSLRVLPPSLNTASTESCSFPSPMHPWGGGGGGSWQPLPVCFPSGC